MMIYLTNQYFGDTEPKVTSTYWLSCPTNSQKKAKDIQFRLITDIKELDLNTLFEYLW